MMRLLDDDGKDWESDPMESDPATAVNWQLSLEPPEAPWEPHNILRLPRLISISDPRL